jgi:Tol biopolymer transport system component
MMSPAEALKRKNSASKNRRLLPLTMLIIAASAIALLWWSHSQPQNDLPIARLMYPSSDSMGFTALNLQTGEQLKLPFEDLHDRKLSPDGKWSARWYDINLCCDAFLWISPTDPDLKDIQLGLNYGSSRSISWSPDSQWIAFSAIPQANNYYENSNWSAGAEEIYLQNIFTYEEKRLTQNGFTDRYPSISPDSTQIAYTSDADGVERLYIMDIETHTSRLLTPEREGYKPIWSPDGRWIAFTSNCKPHPEYVCVGGDLWLIRADGTGAQQVVSGTGFIEAIWLP